MIPASAKTLSGISVTRRTRGRWVIFFFPIWDVEVRAGTVKRRRGYAIMQLEGCIYRTHTVDEGEEVELLQVPKPIRRKRLAYRGSERRASILGSISIGCNDRERSWHAFSNHRNASSLLPKAAYS